MVNRKRREQERLFMAEVMNMVWVAALTVLVLLEKVTLPGIRLSIATGVLLVAWGRWVISGYGL